MTEDDTWIDEIKQNSRGANSYWYWKYRPLIDEGIAKDVLTALNLTFEHLRSRHQDDPPDCEAIVNGCRTGIELTELAHERTLRSNIKDKERQRFLLWDKTKLRAELQRLIARKDKPKTVKGDPYERYFLIVHTDENSLSNDNVAEFLRGETFQSQFITESYFVLPPLFGELTVHLLELTYAHE